MSVCTVISRFGDTLHNHTLTVLVHVNLSTK